jgi:hypothetical protein
MVLVMIVVTHQIAGIIFRTESNSYLPRLQEEHFERFRVSNKIEPDISHRIQKINPDSISLSFQTSEEQERVSRNKHDSSEKLESPLLCYPALRTRLKECLDRQDQVDIRLDKDQVTIRNFARRELDIFCSPEFGGNPSEFHVSANFPRMFSSFLPCFSAILIHSSGVIRKGKAAVFLAPGEGGKTTVVKLSTGMPVLHDDQIVFRMEGDVISAYATPMGRNTSGPCQARIGALFMLEKATHFELEPLKPADLVQCLWTEHIGYTFFLPKNLKKQAFQILSNVCYKVPVYRMRFPKDYVDWDAIDAAMEGKIAS